MNYGKREFRRRRRGRAQIRADFSRNRSTRSISIRMWRSKARVEYNEYVNIRQGARGTLSLVNSGVRVTGGVLSVSPGVASVSSLVTLDNGVQTGGGPRRCNVGWTEVGLQAPAGPSDVIRCAPTNSSRFHSRRLRICMPVRWLVMRYRSHVCARHMYTARGTCMALKVNGAFLRSLVTAR